MMRCTTHRSAFTIRLTVNIPQPWSSESLKTENVRESFPKPRPVDLGPSFLKGCLSSKTL